MKRTNIIPSFLSVSGKKHKSSNPKVVTNPNELAPCYDSLLWWKNVGRAACSHDTHPPSVCVFISGNVKVKVCPCLIKVPVGPVSTGTPCLYSHSSHNSHGQIKRDTFILNTFSLELQIHLDSVSVGG